MIFMWLRYAFSRNFAKMTGRSSCFVRIGKNKVTFDAEYYVNGDPEVEIFIPRTALWDMPKKAPISIYDIQAIKDIIPDQLRKNDGIKSVKITDAQKVEYESGDEGR